MTNSENSPMRAIRASVFGIPSTLRSISPRLTGADRVFATAEGPAAFNPATEDGSGFGFRISDFIRHSSFVIRYSNRHVPLV